MTCEARVSNWSVSYICFTKYTSWGSSEMVNLPYHSFILKLKDLTRHRNRNGGVSHRTVNGTENFLKFSEQWWAAQSPQPPSHSWIFSERVKQLAPAQTPKAAGWCDKCGRGTWLALIRRKDGTFSHGTQVCRGLCGRVIRLLAQDWGATRDLFLNKL